MFIATAVLTLLCGTPADAPYVVGPSATWATPPLRFSSPPRAPLTYRFNLTPGQYSVTLTFKEPNATAPGQRVFDISFNGAGAVLANLDLYAVAGKNAYERTFPVPTVAGGQITLALTPSVGNAVISRIRIETADISPPTPTATGLQIICPRGTVSYSALADSVVIMPAVADTFRILHVMFLRTQPFSPAGQLYVKLRAGSMDLTPDVNLMDTSPSWQDRTSWPISSGPYDIALRFTRPATPFTAGALYWEVCGFNVP